MQAVGCVCAVHKHRQQEQQLIERRYIPDHLKDTHPFSATTLWTYYARTYRDPEGETCPYCNQFDGQTFPGTYLRSIFPDYFWVGDDIYPNVHKTLWNKDTCACLLIREPDEVSTNLDMAGNLTVDFKSSVIP